MELSPMRFKEFVWPHNPRTYSITMERRVVDHKIPFGRHYLQSLGHACRVFRGEGEFVGEGAYDTFQALANVFYEETPGALVHPVWMATTAWFVGLKLEQRPQRDYVRYSFEFWEVVSQAKGTLTIRSGETAVEQTREAHLWHTVGKGDSLWRIARQYSTTVERLMELNPEIENPNLILVGQKVRIR